jgi:DNA-binding NarL/FixJ family response regulator
MNVAAPALDISVLLADDHQLMREGLRRLLEATPGLRVVGEAGNGHEALDVLRRTPVDVAVLDLSMPGMTGMDLIRRVKTEFPHVAVLVLTMHAEEQYAMRAFRCGANGYLTKDSAGTELVQAIRKVAGGGGYVTASLAERLAIGLNTLREAPAHASLSDREFEVLRGICAGQRLTEIAEALHLSVKTVSTHKTRILEKMGLDSTAALIRYGLENRLLDDPDSQR